MARFRFTWMVVLLMAQPLFAGYTAREAWLPVVGRTVGSGGRGFFTDVMVSAPADRAVHLTVTYFPSTLPAQARTIERDVAAGQASTIEVGSELVGPPGGTGALRIRGNQPFTATARLASRGATPARTDETGTTVNAIPSVVALGTGEKGTVFVPPDATRYKLYVVETAGYPVYVSTTAVDASGRDLQARRLYLQAYEQRSWDLGDLFGPIRPVLLRIEPVNGSGKIIAAGSEITPSQDFSVYEMSFPPALRHRMPRAELAAYAVVAVAIAAAAVVSRRPRSQPRTGAED